MLFCSFSLFYLLLLFFLQPALCFLLFLVLFFLFSLTLVFFINGIIVYKPHLCFVRQLDFIFIPPFLYPLGCYKHDRGVFVIFEFEKSTQLFVVIPNIVSNFAPVI